MTAFAPPVADFPALALPLHGRRVAFLDSAASAQKPQAVIDAMAQALAGPYANIHRGLYGWSEDLTARFEVARARVARFIGAANADEVVFTRGATEAINLVAQSWGRANLYEGDEVVLTIMEHHANIVPWQLLQAERDIVIKVVPMDDRGVLDLGAFEGCLTHRTKLVAVTHISNALGTVNPVAEIAAIAKDFYPDMRILVDGAQGVVHGVADVVTLGADWYVFSGHKLYGPTGIGVLWGRVEVLDAMPPWQGGGDMIEDVSFDGTTFKAPPARFEAGTPAIAEAIGLAAAMDYLDALGTDAIAQHERDLLLYAAQRLGQIEDLTLHGTAPGKAGIVSFTLDGLHHADVATLLAQCGVAVRAGHHCCMPLMRRLGVPGTIRASLGLYSTREDIDQLVQGLYKAKEMLT
jgi:cysteine desulfurase/selenocysteine lyase